MKNIILAVAALAWMTSVAAAPIIERETESDKYLGALRYYNDRKRTVPADTKQSVGRYYAADASRDNAVDKGNTIAHYYAEQKRENNADKPQTVSSYYAAEAERSEEKRETNADVPQTVASYYAAEAERSENKVDAANTPGKYYVVLPPR